MNYLYNILSFLDPYNYGTPKPSKPYKSTKMEEQRTYDDISLTVEELSKYKDDEKIYMMIRTSSVDDKYEKILETYGDITWRWTPILARYAMEMSAKQFKKLYAEQNWVITIYPPQYARLAHGYDN